MDARFLARLEMVEETPSCHVESRPGSTYMKLVIDQILRVHVWVSGLQLNKPPAPDHNIAEGHSRHRIP